MKINDFKKVAKLIRSTEVYDVLDYPLKNLTLSATILHPGQATGGHTHDQEEVYLFLDGYNGKIQIGKHEENCEVGDFFAISSGEFHKVWNNGAQDLKFICVFEKYER